MGLPILRRLSRLSRRVRAWRPTPRRGRTGGLGLEWREGVLVGVELEAGREGRAAPARWGQVAFGEEDPLTGERLRDFFRRCGFRSKRARLAVSGRDLSVKSLELPALPPEDVREVLREDGDRFFLLPRGRRVYGLLGEAEDGRTVAVAAPDELIEALVDAAGEAGVWVESVTAAAAVYPTALRQLDGPGSDTPERLVLVREWGPERERVRYREGRPVELSVGTGPKDTRLGAGDGSEGGEPGSEEQMSCRLLHDPPPAPAPGDEDAAAAAGPSAGWTGARGSAGSAALPGPGKLAGALGVAALERPDVAGPDLLPAAVRARRKRAEDRLTLLLGGLVAALALGLILAVPHGRARAERAVDEALAAAREAAAPVIAMEAEIDLISREVGVFGRVAALRDHQLGVLTRLTEALPERAWLTSFASPNPTEVHLAGYGPSAAEVLQALASLPGVEDARLERTATKVRASDGERESFDVVLWLSEAAVPRRAEPTNAGAE